MLIVLHLRLGLRLSLRLSIASVRAIIGVLLVIVLAIIGVPSQPVSNPHHISKKNNETINSLSVLSVLVLGITALLLDGVHHIKQSIEVSVRLRLSVTLVRAVVGVRLGVVGVAGGRWVFLVSAVVALGWVGLVGAVGALEREAVRMGLKERKSRGLWQYVRSCRS